MEHLHLLNRKETIPDQHLALSSNLFFPKPGKMEITPFQWVRASSLLLILSSQILQFSLADVGTAAQYSSPYLPSACYGNDASEIPSSNLFAAAGDGIWDNGASCGRQYLVRCISASVAGSCIPDQTIQLEIVDYAGSLVSPPSSSGTTLVLSFTAFSSIANSTVSDINIEFLQV